MSRAFSVGADAAAAAPVRPSWLERLARRAVFASLRNVAQGRLVIREGRVRTTFGKAGTGPEAEVIVHDPAVYPAVAFGGTIGAGEAFMAGHFSSPHLLALVRLFVRNRELMNGMDRGGAALLRWPLHKLAHWLNANTRTGSRRNIAAHYDLGNDFFALFLDRRWMMYSAALYPRPAAGLEEAAEAKLAHICRKLRLGPAHHVLEIGTGWGGFALHAARTRGCRVTTTTVSRAQYDYAREQVRRAGLEDRITVLLRDYRELEGRFDKLVSIEMIEAVGHRNLPAFFAQCNRLLKPDGEMLLQAITIAEGYHEEAKHAVDFIQRYIFPGGCLPSVAAMMGQVAAQTDFRLAQLEEFGSHYARTLRHWRERFEAHRSTLQARGFGPEFQRMWLFYLVYCEGGFRERALGTVHLLLRRMGNDAPPLLPALA